MTAVSGDSTITVSGWLPVNAYVTAEPVETIYGEDVLFAFDISVFYEDGSVFEPVDDTISVTISSPDIQEGTTIYYVSDENNAEMLESESIDGNVFFEASHFSTYVGASPVAATGTGDAYVSSVGISSLVDGTTPFDSSDEAGNDSGNENLIVRSFDYINYTLSYTTALSNLSNPVDSGNLYIEFILPVSPSIAVFNKDSMNWVANPVVTYTFADGSSDTSYSDPDEVVSQVLTGYRSLSNAEYMTIPGSGTLSVSIYVGSAQNGDVIQPSFKLWMEGDDREVACQPDAVTVSAAQKFAIQIKQASEMDVYGTYDLSTGNENAAQDTISNATTVRGRMEAYGITVMMQNDSVEKGLKGLEFPTGDITFDITLNEYAMSSVGALLSNQEGYTPILWDYDENLGQESIGEWGRNFVSSDSSNLGRAYCAAPFNVLGCHKYSSVYNSCYDGGDWTIEQDADNPLVYHVTIKNYSVDTENYDFPTANNKWYLATEDGTDYKANQACITSGVIQVVLQFPFGTVGEITNIYMKVAADNFAVSDTSYSIRASSANTFLLLPEGNIITTINFCKEKSTGATTGNILSSTNEAGDAAEFAGNNVRLWTSVRTTTDETVETIIEMVLWDADAFEIDQTSVYYPIPEYPDITVCYVARKSNWSDVQEMSDTLLNDPSLYYYTSLDELEADGNICVGVIYVHDVSVSGPNVIQTYPMDLKVKETAVVGETYAATVQGWASYSDVNPLTQVGETSQYTLDTAMIENPDLYIAFCSIEAIKAMGGDLTEDAYYVKSEYDDEGNILAGTHINGLYGGNSLLILGEKASVELNIRDTGSDGSAKRIYDMDAGERTVNYSIQPYIEVEGSATSGSGTATGKTTATVKVILPYDLTYDIGSSYWGDTPITPVVSTDESGITTLTYTLENAEIGVLLDEITFSATIGHAGTIDDVVNNQLITAEATIASTGDNRSKLAVFGNYASTSFYVVKLLAISIAKNVDQTFIENNGSFSWELLFVNGSDNDLISPRLVDILPFSGDDMGSRFSGSYEIRSIDIDFSDAPNTYQACLDSMKFYVTDSSSPGEAADLVTDGVSSDWTDQRSYASVDQTTLTIPGAGLADITAFCVELAELAANENLTITVHVDTIDNEAGDIYQNVLYEYGEGQSSYIVSNDTWTQVVERTISGLAWLDSSRNGIREDDEEILSGITVSLYRADPSEFASGSGAAAVIDGTDLHTAFNVFGEAVSSEITGTDGTYLFRHLEAGIYYIVFSDMDNNYGVTELRVGDDRLVDSDTTSVSSGGTLLYAVVSGEELPELEDMGYYLYEAANLDSGFVQSELIFKKAQETDEEDADPIYLSDAVFVIQDAYGKYITFQDGIYSGNTSTIAEECYVTTGSEGSAAVYGLPAGTYQLIEYQAPSGYALNTEAVLFTISEPGESVDAGTIYDVLVKYITFTKVDGSDNSIMLENAVFGLYSDESCQDKYLLETITTDDSGIALSSALVNGTYYVKEKEAPAGYLLDDKVYTVEIGDSDDIIDLGYIENYPNTGSITIIKYKSDGASFLPGVTFECADESGNVVATAKTDENGSIVFSDLSIGTYTITETETVSGYSLLAEPIEATIPLIMTEEEIKEAGNVNTNEAVVIDGKYYFYDLTYQVSNTAALDLPTTGQNQNLVWGMAALLFVADGFMFLLRKKRVQVK